jgi:predicted P-loop ATPase
MQISLYKDAKSTTPEKVVTILDFIHSVKFGTWQAQVQAVRDEKDKEARKLLKEKVPAVTMSGVFSKRNESSLISHSGFICIDIDNYTDKTEIIADKYTYACFDSVSGSGFAVVVKINSNKHKDSFRWLQKYYFDSFGIVVDPAPQNVASLRYVSFDPKVEINERSSTAKTQVELKRKPQSLPMVLSGDKVSEYVKEIIAKGIDLAPTYQEYLNLSFSLFDGFGEAGREYFHALCAMNDRYDSRHANKQFDIAVKRGKSGISVGTFYFMLKQAGIDIKSDSQQVLGVAVMAKKSGKERAAIVEQLVTINKVDEKTAEMLVDEVLKRDDLTLQSINRDPEQLISSLIEWLCRNHPIQRNEITRMIEENGKEVKRERLNTIYLQARSFFNTNEITYDLIERVIFSEVTKDYNPISLYIEKNSYRRSPGNIDQLIKSIETDTPQANVFIKKWCLGIIAAHKGFPVRSVLALIGVQNTGKSEWFRRLLPKDLEKYYGESKLDAGKDDDLLMCQKLIIQDDEMGGKSKEDEKRFKELTSKAVFSLRAPYARANEDFKRLAVLCGTSNTKEIINDRTGNTRILPVNVLSINHALYNNIDKDELFMELYRSFENGEEWLLTSDDLKGLADTSSEFENINYERELLTTYFMTKDDPGLVEWLTATQIKNHIESNSKQQVRNMKNFGIELKRYFGESRNIDNKGRFYGVVKVHLNGTGEPFASTQPKFDPNNPFKLQPRTEYEPQQNLDFLDSDIDF